MSKEIIEENKISFLKTSIPLYPNYQTSDNMGDGLSESEKREIKNDINEFVDNYFNKDK